jgi:hypothetical protein
MRRGQGALEFLMTYGWALLVILVAMIVLWQWGLFNLGERVEPGSFGFWGLTVQQGNEFKLDKDGYLSISLLNTVGANVTLLHYNATIDTASDNCGACTPIVIEPGASRVITLQHDSWRSGSGKRFDSYVTLIYTDVRTGDNRYQSSGRIWGSVEL